MFCAIVVFLDQNQVKNHFKSIFRNQCIITCTIETNFEEIQTYILEIAFYRRTPCLELQSNCLYV